MNGKKILAAWEAFCEGNDFKLNPDKKLVKFLLDGVIKLQKEKGFRLCPCRLQKTKDFDPRLLCPCDFKTHETWKSEGRCWCGLFVKR